MESKVAQWILLLLGLVAALAAADLEVLHRMEKDLAQMFDALERSESYDAASGSKKQSSEAAYDTVSGSKTQSSGVAGVNGLRGFSLDECEMRVFDEAVPASGFKLTPESAANPIKYGHVAKYKNLAISANGDVIGLPTPETATFMKKLFKEVETISESVINNCAFFHGHWLRPKEDYRDALPQVIVFHTKEYCGWSPEQVAICKNFPGTSPDWLGGGSTCDFVNMEGENKELDGQKCNKVCSGDHGRHMVLFVLQPGDNKGSLYYYDTYQKYQESAWGSIGDEGVHVQAAYTGILANPDHYEKEFEKVDININPADHNMIMFACNKHCAALSA